MPRSKANKRLRTGLFFTSVSLLILISFYFRFRAPPLVHIGEIQPFMSLSTVRVEGRLESDARLLRDGGVFYRITDGSGHLSIFLSQPPTGPLPSAGSRIVVEGILGLGTGSALRMNVQSSDQVFIMPEEFMTDFKLSSITAEQDGKRLKVYGRVVKIWHPEESSKAPHKIVLADPSDSLEVIYWFDLKELFQIGDTLQAYGTVGFYKGRIQLKVWRSDDLQLFRE